MCLHLRPWKVCPVWLVCCFPLQLCFCCHPPHPPLALQWSWWAFWLLKSLGESTRNAATREHNEERAHGWTFNPTRKKKNKNLHRKSTGRHGGSEESRLTTTQLSLQLQCFLPSVQCDPVSFWLWGESAASGTWGRPKSRSVFPHSPCSFPSLFTPPSLLTNASAPCDPLFTIWTECSSHYSVSSHSHLCIAQENKVSVKETKAFWILLFESKQRQTAIKWGLLKHARLPLVCC